MIEMLRRVKGFILPFLIFIVLGLLAILVFFDKGFILLWLNGFNHVIWDWLFYYITTLGNGLALVLCAFLLLLYRYRLGIISGLAFGLQGGVTQILKRGVFDETLRPINYFEKISDVHLIQEVSVKGYYTFPSGHTGSAFCLFFILAILTQKPTLQFLSFLMALLVGFSRIYLFQHFFMDVYAGAIIGTLIAFFIFYIANVMAPASLTKQNWWQNKGLLVN